MTDHTPLKRRDLDWHPPAYTPEYRTTVARSPCQPLVYVPHTASDLSGPTFGHADVAPGDANLITNYAAAGARAIGQRITLHGRVLDEDAPTRAGGIVIRTTPILRRWMTILVVVGVP